MEGTKTFSSRSPKLHNFSDLRSCVKVEVNIHGSLTTVSVDVKQHLKKKNHNFKAAQNL